MAAPLRIGLIGCGRIQEEGHAPVLQRMPDVWQVTAVADPTPERLNFISDRFGVPSEARFPDYRDLLRSGLVDAVDIAVPHRFHAPVCLGAARTRTPFLSEKPLATSLKQADEIIAEVKRNDIPAGIMHNYLNRPSTAAALSAIEAGRIGRPFMFRMEHMGSGWYVGAAAYDPTWRSRREDAGGGALLDNGYHNLYTAEAMLQSPITHVSARVGTHVQKQDVDDTAALMLGHASGATSIVLAAWSAISATGLTEVHGDLGSIRLDRGEAVLHTGDRTEVLESTDADELGFTPIFRRFADAVRGDAPPLHTLTEGRRNLELVFAGYDSAIDNQIIDVRN